MHTVTAILGGKQRVEYKRERLRQLKEHGQSKGGRVALRRLGGECGGGLEGAGCGMWGVTLRGLEGECRGGFEEADGHGSP